MNKRLQIIISEEELADLDEWRAENQVWSRSKAIRQLIRFGMDRTAPSTAYFPDFLERGVKEE